LLSESGRPGAGDSLRREPAFGGDTPAPAPTVTSAELHRAPPHPARAAAVLQELMLLDGLVFAALVDINTGQVIASEGRGPDIDRAAAAAAEVLSVHRRTLRLMGHWRPNDPVDEVLVTAGSRYHILRTLQAHPDLFILAVLDKLRSNLAMTLFRIMEAQQVLV
jgi:predicted regulator of Ras-like GTPase activity (Roadblock/LC7/MglB family)